MAFWDIFIELCEKFNVKPNPVGKELGISSGTITLWKNGSMPSGEKLLLLADYFNCSTDYLLGRTDNPNITNSISNTNTTVNGTQANVINSNNYNQKTVAEQTDEMTRELLKAFKALPFKDKMDIMNAVMKKTEQ